MGHSLHRVRTLVAIGIACTLGACGGGGGGGGNGISFSFATSATTLSESDGPTSLDVVLHLTIPALTEDVSVDVADAGTGTASSGADYVAFAPTTLTFPAGSVDGATQSFTLDPLDDSLIDGGNETVRLKFQDAVGGGVSGIKQFTVTIADIHVAEVSFATGSDAAPDEVSGAQTIALELDCGPGVTLGVAASVRVSDLHTGSATPPGDYAAFAAQTVTFPAGSADGALQTVALAVADDTLTEGDETVELGLSAPSTTCTLGAIQTHVLTIQDDDGGGNAAFQASEGPTGTGNVLSYDETIPLGSQTVGAGPNTGTLLRLANVGGLDMELGAPSLTGANNQDFALDIESSSFERPDPESAFPVAVAAAPLAALADDGGPGRALRLERQGLGALRDLREVALRDLELPGLGPVTLQLARRPLPIAEDAKLVVDGREIPGGPRVLLGDLQLWSGSVAGLAGSRVFLALGEAGVRGFVDVPNAPDRMLQLVTDEHGALRALSVPELAGLGLDTAPELCAGERYVPGVVPIELRANGLPNGEEPVGSALTLANCRLALETDYQLYQRFNSSVLLTNYVTELIAAVSDQYATDVQSTFTIAYLGIHTDSNDGWDAQETMGADAGTLLDEFQATWGSTWPATADLAHFLSGASLGGGVAYVDVLCNHSFGFGVSANLAGNINWAAWTGQAAGFTWDFVVTAHELGHNFGSQHTHSYCPNPLDRCYTSGCVASTTCSRGTIMSYCHLCGGMSNIDLYFHPVCANIMRQRINASCLGTATLTGGDFVQYRLRFNPLTTAGAKAATLTFSHDAPNATQPFRVQLSGVAN